MKTTNNLKKSAIIALNLASLVSPMQNRAEDSYDTRTRVEMTEAQTSAGNLSKFTFGVTPLRSKTPNGESFRAYNYQGEGVHYLTASAKIRAFNLAGITNDLVLLGSAGTREDAGIKSIFTFEDFKLDLEAEQSRNAQGKSTRLGGGLDYKLDSWMFSAGFDSVNTPKDKISSPSASILWDVTENDQTGVGFKRSFCEKDTINSIGAYYMHWGKDASWGTRTSAKYSWNEKQDIQTLNWQSIILSGTPTFSHDYGAVATRRDYGYWLGSEVAENPVETVERQYPGKRTKGGIVIQSDGQITTKQGAQSGFVKNHLAYTIPVGKGNFAPGVFQRNDFNAKSSVQTLGATGLLRTPMGKRTSLELEFSAGKRISGELAGADKDYELYGNLQVCRKF